MVKRVLLGSRKVGGYDVLFVPDKPLSRLLWRRYL